MTPKEKAKELFDKFYNYADSNYGASEFEKNWHGNVLAGERKVRKESANQCALTAVDEILNSFFNIFDDSVIESSKVGGYRNMKKYWQEVKQEIEKL
jgi:hypothetical protein